MKTLILALLSFSLPFLLKAYDPPIKWGEVPAEDLAMTSYDNAPEASAVLLCDFSSMTFDFINDKPGFKQIVHKRFKILNREGFKHGNVAIVYMAKWQQIRNLKAQLFTPGGKKISLSKDAIFHNKLENGIHEKKFLIPGLIEGAVFEYHYEIQHIGNLNIPNWYFQKDIPVRHSEFQLEAIEYLNYISLMQGGDYEINKETKIEKSFIDNNKRVKVGKTRYWVTNTAPIKKEAFVSSANNYASRVWFQLSSMSLPGWTINNITTWEDVGYQLIMSGSVGENFTRKSRYRKVWNAAKPHLEGLKENKKKIKVLYDFVNVNIKENKVFGIYLKNSPNEQFAKGRADSPQLNMILLALLKESKLKAYPVFISTRSNGLIYELFPFKAQFDHMIIAVELDEGVVFLDGGDQDRPPGVLRLESRSYRGLLVKGKETRVINLPTDFSTDSYVYKCELNPDGTMNGTLNARHAGFSALMQRKNFREDPTGGNWKKDLSDRFPDIEITSFETQHLEKPVQPFIEQVEFKLPEASLNTDERIYFDPIIHSKFATNIFSSEKRSYPIEFPYGLKEQYGLSIKIPEGYEVEELPESFTETAFDGHLKMIYECKVKNNSIQVISSIAIKRTIFSTEEYPDFRAFFEKAEEKLNEQIVLRKSPESVFNQK